MILKEKFQKGMKLNALPLSWFRRVTAWINNFCEGPGIHVSNPSEPGDAAPVKVSIDEAWLEEKVREFMSSPSPSYPPPVADTTNIDNTQTGDGGVEGIATATNTTAYQIGDTVMQTAGRIYALDPGEGAWEAGGAKGLKMYEISRMVPFIFGSGNNPARYAKIFTRLVTRNHNGQVVSVGDEVDQGIVVRLG